MPGAVAGAGLTDKILPLPQIGPALRERALPVGLRRGGDHMTLQAPDFTFVTQLVRQRSSIDLQPGKEYLVESRLAPVARKSASGTSRVSSPGCDPATRRSPTSSSTP